MKRVFYLLLASALVFNLTAFALADDEVTTVDETATVDGTTEVTAEATTEQVSEGATQTETPVVEVKTFTIDQAIAYAKENSKALKTKKAAMDSAEVSLNQAKFSKFYSNRSTDSAAESISKMTNEVKKQAAIDMLACASDDAALQSAYTTNGYYVDVAQVSYDNAKLAYDEAVRTIDTTVKASFYSYILANDKISIAKQSMDNANARYEEAKLKYEQGLMSAMDLESYRISTVNSQNTYNALVRKQTLVMDSFKQTIGCPIDEPIELIGTFTRIAMDDTPLDTAIAGAKNSVNAKYLNNSYEANKKGFAIVGRLYGGSRYEYKSAKATFESSELSYQQNIELLPMSAIYYYNTMVSAYDNLNYLDAQIANTEIQVEAQRIRCNQGLITVQDYIESVQNLDNLKISLKDAELGAYQSVINYQTSYTTGSFVYALN